LTSGIIALYSATALEGRCAAATGPEGIAGADDQLRDQRVIDDSDLGVQDNITTTQLKLTESRCGSADHDRGWPFCMGVLGDTGRGNERTRTSPRHRRMRKPSRPIASAPRSLR
jgi:hypothetical protein